jgi:hypothetical protein
MNINQYIKNSLALTLLLNFNAMAEQPTVNITDNERLFITTELNKTASYQVTLSGPNNFYLRKTFKPGSLISFDLNALPSDGLIKTEIIEQPFVEQKTQELARVKGDTFFESTPIENILNMNFRLNSNDLIENIDKENDYQDKSEITLKAQTIATDLIVQGSTCVGFDCSSSESFGSDTIRLKENNLRIHFDDTSNSASFASNDWRLEANATTNGGAEYFSIVDATANRTPFTIEAGASNNSLYVDDAGNIGIGTNSPVVETHIVDGDTPTLRLEQNGSSGFGSQTWDVAGNETNFFVRDVNAGSKIPFKIRPGSNDNQIVIHSNKIGFNELSPQQDLHIKKSGNATIGLESTATNDPDWTIGNNGATDRFEISDTTDGNVSEDLDGAEFSLDATGNLTIAGLLVQNSNVHAKHHITELSPAKILEKVKTMPIHQWQYKAMQGNHIGPMAQDFHSTFQLGQDESKIATLDVAGVALVAIQGLSQELNERDDQIKSLEQKISQLEAANLKQQQQLSNLESYESRLANIELLYRNYEIQSASNTIYLNQNDESEVNQTTLD